MTRTGGLTSRPLFDPSRPQGKLVLVALALVLAGGGLGAWALSRPRVPDIKLFEEARTKVLEYKQAKGVDYRLTILEVQIVVREGVVYLKGKTDSPALAQELSASIRRLPGVRRVADELAVLPPASLQARPLAIVNVPVLNLGMNPGYDTGKSLVTQAIMGQVVELVEEEMGWYRVRMPCGYLGWVDGRRIVILDRTGVEAYLGGTRAKVTATVAKVFAQTSPASRVIAEPTLGTVLKAGAAHGTHGYVQVWLPDGAEGFIPQQHVKVFDSDQAVFAQRGSAVDVLNTAKQFLGQKYLWGGTSALGMDCSGLVQFSFRLNGYNLPRDADMQYGAGSPVADRADLRPGDLVFFTTYKAGPSHVGIYLGDGRYIHDGNSGVAINSFNPAHSDYEPSLDSKYLGARRIID